jgi:hypothetical protein
MLKPIWYVALVTTLQGCALLGVGSNESAYIAPVFVSKSSVMNAANPLAGYSSVVVSASASERQGVIGFADLLQANMDYLVDRSASIAGVPLRVCRQVSRCSGRIAVVRYIEDGFDPWATGPVLLGARLEGYLVVIDARTDALLASYRVLPSESYEGVFLQIRGALASALVGAEHYKKTERDFVIASINEFPVIKPEYAPIFFAGRAPAVVWSDES